jgi:hypothetical protein
VTELRADNPIGNTLFREPRERCVTSVVESDVGQSGRLA